MRKIFYLILLVFLVSCISRPMRKVEGYKYTAISSDTIVEVQIKVWPEAEYVLEEITYPVSKEKR